MGWHWFLRGSVCSAEQTYISSDICDGYFHHIIEVLLSPRGNCCIYYWCKSIFLSAEIYIKNHYPFLFILPFRIKHVKKLNISFRYFTRGRPVKIPRIVPTGNFRNSCNNRMQLRGVSADPIFSTTLEPSDKKEGGREAWDYIIRKLLQHSLTTYCFKFV